MADVYTVLHVCNSTTGAGYKRGTDWTDDGDGTVTLVPGSDAATDFAGGDTLKISRTKTSDTAPTAGKTFKLDTSYSGVVKIANPNTAFASGTTINAHADSFNISEHGEEMQTNFSFNAHQSDSSAQGLVKGDYVALRIGTVDQTGTTVARYEWRGKVVARDWTRDPRSGEGVYKYSVGDFSELIREADTTAIPRTSQADLIPVPGDSSSTGNDLPPQTLKGGPRAYTLSQLLTEIQPANTSFRLNAPDIIIERLPQEGDAFDLLLYVLRAAGYYLHWETYTMVIQQHEGAEELISCTLTDGHVLEVRTERGTRRDNIDNVVIEKPGTGDGLIEPDRDKPPTNGTGGAVLPNQERTEEAHSDALAGEVTLYRVDGTWEPPEPQINYEPGPIMFGFSDTTYNTSGYTGQQIANILRMFPGQVSIIPPVNYTTTQVYGPNGFDWYFLIPPINEKIASQNLDTVWGYVVSRNGYFSATGAITRDSQPIAGATVVLVGLNTGIVLGPTTTTSDGYYSVSTGGNRDRWLPSVYVSNDDYLANKNDIFTDGHPYDDDPANDETGPSNLVEVDDTWQLYDTPVSFQVRWKTGREAPDGPLGDTSDLYEAYKGSGSLYFGTAGTSIDKVTDIADLDIDSANVTSEVQGGLLAEKLIDRSSEESDTLVVTKVFGGEATAVGRVVQLSITAGDGYTGRMRVMSRAIRVLEGYEVEESLSTQADAVFTQLDRAFARRSRVESALTKLTARTRDQQRILDQFTNNIPPTDGLGI